MCDFQKLNEIQEGYPCEGCKLEFCCTNHQKCFRYRSWFALAWDKVVRRIRGDRSGACTKR
jgi:hypothetical protein